MKNIKLWHAGVMALAVAVVAGAGVWLYQRYSSNAEAAALPNAARIQRVDGLVAVNDSLADESAENWVAAAPNQVFSVGDRIYTRDNARASLALTGRNFVRLDPNTAMDAVVLTDDRTQLALREGTALFDVGYLPSGGLYEVGTPSGAVDFYEPGLYQVGINNNGNTVVSVLSGLAQVAGLGSNGRIGKGEMLTMLGMTAAEVVLSRLNNRDAGYLVDDYYRYQYPNYYDGRYASYDAYANDPFYFDPYRRNASYQYVSYAIPGVNDLDNYGDWVQTSNYGYAWRPRVDAGWVPYQDGYWVNDYPYGPTWVSSEPWGYAPYHYGRWTSSNNQWVWIPDGVNTTPQYSPALVAFMPFDDNTIGWVPLGPGDPYAYRYYDQNWQPHYLSRLDSNRALVNLAVPNAVTVVPVDALGRPIDPRVVRRVDPQTIAQVRPGLEPLLITPLRNAALRSAWGRGKIDVPPGIAKRLRDTTVVLNTAPLAPPFRKDLAKSLRVQEVKNPKFKVRDDRNAGVSESDAVRRQQQIDALAGEAARGDKDARRQVHELERQQKAEQSAQSPGQQKKAERIQGERVSNPKPQPPIQMKKPERQVMAPRPQPQIKQGRPEAPKRSAAPQMVRPQGPPAAVKHGGGGGQPGGGGKHGGGPPPGQSKGGGGGKGKKP